MKETFTINRKEPKWIKWILRKIFIPISAEPDSKITVQENCKKCGKELSLRNKSGYCTRCYIGSPQMKEYQRRKQREFYYRHKDRRRAYYNKPQIKEKRKKYMKKYIEEHKDKLRVLKRNWSRKRNNIPPERWQV